MRKAHARKTQAQNNRRPARPRMDSRAGLLMTPAMDFGGIAHVEAAFFQEGVALAPLDCGAGSASPYPGVSILPTAEVEDVRAGTLGGIIVPGGAKPRKAGRNSRFVELIRAARESDLPIMAFGAGAGDTLDALDISHEGGLPPAILLNEGVLILESIDDVRDSVRGFRVHPAEASHAH